MATVVTVSHQSFVAFRDALLAAVEADERTETETLMTAFAGRIGAAVADSNLDEIAELRAHAARLRRRLGALRPTPRLAMPVSERLHALDAVLDSSRTAILVRRDAEERQQTGLVLRDRIVELLATEPLRPRDLAEQFDCDPSQVSRALRELQDDGRVVTVPPPSGSSDARARWFGLGEARYAARLAN